MFNTHCMNPSTSLPCQWMWYPDTESVMVGSQCHPSFSFHASPSPHAVSLWWMSLSRYSLQHSRQFTSPVYTSLLSSSQQDTFSNSFLLCLYSRSFLSLVYHSTVFQLHILFLFHRSSYSTLYHSIWNKQHTSLFAASSHTLSSPTLW